MATSTPTAPASAASIESKAGLQPVAAPTVVPGSTVLTVGQGEEYATVGAAVAAAQDGDTILVNAGTYENDFATVTAANLTIEGVGGMVDMVATEPPTNLKGIITVDNSCTIENMSFSGAAIDPGDGGNGAGIRYEGGAMTLINDSFSNNQDGVMGMPVIPGLTANTVSISHCVFDHNGSGSGYTHNLYIGDVTNLNASDSVFEGAVVGHEFKSRALSNTISGNVFSDGPTGTASYDIDLPNGGNDTITGNVIEKGPDAENDAMVHFGGEGIPFAGSQLTISGNDFIDDLGPQAMAVLNQTAISATITGNSFANLPASNILQGPGTESGNVDGNGNAIASNTLTGVLPGSTMIITDTLAHTVTLGNALQAVEGGSGLLTVIDPIGHIVAIGGSGGMDFTEQQGAGGNQITTAAGSANILQLVGQDVVDSQGIDTITTGTGNITGQVTGNAVIHDGDAADQWAILGTVTIDGSGGDPVVSVGAGANATILGPLGYLDVQNNGGTVSIDITQGGVEEQASITGGATDLKVYAGAVVISTAAGAQGADIVLGACAAQVTSLGADTIQAGSGADTIIVGAHATIDAGTGALAVYGRGDNLGAVVYGNGGTVLLGGDTGNITYYGGAKASTVTLQLSNNTLVGGAGLLTVLGGSAELMEGGSGGLIYDGSDGGGANTISTMQGASDTLTLGGADTVVSRGNDVIFGGTGNQTIAAYGTTTIHGSTGASNLDLYGQETLLGVATDFVTVHQGADVTLHAGNQLYVNETGATATVVATPQPNHVTATLQGGAATATVTSPGTIAVATTAGTRTEVALVGGTQTVQSQGSDVIRAWSGSDTISINVANTHVFNAAATLIVSNNAANGANDWLTGGSGTVSYSQEGADLHFRGGSGSATLNGGWGTLDVNGGSGQLAISGGNGLNFTGGSGSASIDLSANGGSITFGSGATTVTEAGWGGPAIYNFVAGSGGGTDVIAGFRAGTDHLMLQGVTETQQSVVGGSTMVTLSDNTHLQLAGFVGTGSLFG